MNVQIFQVEVSASENFRALWQHNHTALVVYYCGSSEVCLCIHSAIVNSWNAVLDMSQHIQLYQAVMSLLEAIADNPQTQQLLVLPVHDKQDTNQAGSPTLATVLKKLEGIAHSYSKTMR